MEYSKIKKLLITLREHGKSFEKHNATWLPGYKVNQGYTNKGLAMSVTKDGGVYISSSKKNIELLMDPKYSSVLRDLIFRKDFTYSKSLKNIEKSYIQFMRDDYSPKEVKKMLKEDVSNGILKDYVEAMSGIHEAIINNRDAIYANPEIDKPLHRSGPMTAAEAKKFIAYINDEEAKSRHLANYIMKGQIPVIDEDNLK